MDNSLKTQSMEGYIIRHISVSCPECTCGFSTPSLVELPPVTEYDTIEADLHRVLPDAELRAAMIAVCPHCNYANWTARFKPSNLSPEFYPDAAEVPHTKKYALAVKWARDKMVSPLDIAFIALNGLYCAREAGEDSDLWLELAAYEQSRGIAEELVIPPTGQDYLIMAELWRQLGSFENALACYEQARADADAELPPDLLDQQIKLCQMGNTSPTVLPPYMVREIFPEAQLFDMEEPELRNVPNVIERKPKPDRLDLANMGPPIKREFTPEEMDAEYQMMAGEYATPLAVQAPPPEYYEEEPAAQYDETAQDFEDAIGATEQPVVEQPVVQQPAVQQPAAQQPQPGIATGDHVVSLAKVRQIIAQPSGASAIYLVQAASIPQADTTTRGPKNKAKRKPDGDPLPKIDMPANEYFAGSSSPNGEQEQPQLSPVQRALNKAMRKDKDQGNKSFPEVQLTDEYPEQQYQATYEDYEYAQMQVNQDLGYQQQQQQVAASAQDQQQQQGNGSDFSGAIAQVESFLNLRRSPSYQSWIRSYKD